MKSQHVLQLSQTLEVPSLHAVHAMLFGISAELLSQSPRVDLLNELNDGLSTLADSQMPAAQVGLLLSRELERALTDEVYYRTVWHEYQDLLNPMSQVNIQPWASKHCDPDRVKHEPCTLESGKPCPFGDWYCAYRMGSPCDHVSAALGIASQLWSDLAHAVSAEDCSIKRNRCALFSRAHLAVWVPPIGDALLRRARTNFYQVTALLIGSLAQLTV